MTSRVSGVSEVSEVSGTGLGVQEENKRSLLALVSERIEVMEEVVANEGELSDELEEAIRGNSLELSKKVDSYGHILGELDFRAESFRKRAQGLAAKARALEGKAEFLRERLKEALKRVGSLKGSEVEFALGKPTASIELKDGVSFEDLPEKFVRVKRELDKSLVKQCWGELGDQVRSKFSIIEKPKLLERDAAPRRKK